MNSINLIRTKTVLSPQLEMVMILLQKLSLWALAILIVSGSIVSGIFYYLKVRDEQLMHTQQQLSQIIAQSTTKEGLLFTVKHRTALTSKILGAAQPVGKVFDTISTFVTADQMTAVSLDDHNKVFLTIHVQSIADVVGIADTLIKQVAAQTVRSPELVSLSLGHSGGIDVALSFIVRYAH